MEEYMTQASATSKREQATAGKVVADPDPVMPEPNGGR